MSDAHRKIGGAGERISLGRALESAWQCVAFYFALVVLALVCLAWFPFAWILRRVLSADTGRRVGRSVVQRVWQGYFVLLRTLGACRFDLAGLDSLAGQSAMILARAARRGK